ncbi:MAG: hypothetical protein IJE41_04690 [Clostridia bacterium]|nr:hypothetical protein [Clostridia bacterium]MBR2884980.1 hypothetical protein [Clostridia bacterium]
MNMYNIAAAAVCIAVLALTVKNVRAEMGQLISVAAVIAVFAATMPYIIKIVSSMHEFAAMSKSGAKYLEPMLKITGLAYISQMGAQLCEDSGEKALAGRVEMAGKIAICTVAVPIAKEAFVKIIGILI